MIEDFFNDYTAKEFLDWLSEEYADEYIKEVIHRDDNDDTIINDMFDIERLKRNFTYSIHRYTVIERGLKFYIHDERNCVDIMMFKYDIDNYEETLERVNEICDELNQGNVNFIGKKYKCY